MPTQLFQGSLLLGSIASSVLGEEAMRSGNVLIHPVLIGGWCGLVATALNSLPVGSLDGGKMFQVRLSQKQRIDSPHSMRFAVVLAKLAACGLRLQQASMSGFPQGSPQGSPPQTLNPQP